MSRYIDADKLWNDRPQIPEGKSQDYGAGFSECMWGFSQHIRKQIDNPTADVVEVRHGYWLSAYEYALKLKVTEERLKSAKEDKRWKFCSLCEQQVKWDFNYCPNCGAKMDGERREK